MIVRQNVLVAPDPVGNPVTFPKRNHPWRLLAVCVSITGANANAELLLAMLDGDGNPVMTFGAPNVGVGNTAVITFCAGLGASSSGATFKSVSLPTAFPVESGNDVILDCVGETVNGNIIFTIQYDDSDLKT